MILYIKNRQLPKRVPQNPLLQHDETRCAQLGPIGERAKDPLLEWGQQRPHDASGSLLERRASVRQW